MIKKILNEQGLQLEIAELEKRSFSKLNYNSFSEIRNIEKLKAKKNSYSPHYLSNKYGLYHDHRINKLLYGNSARTLERGIFSIAGYYLIVGQNLSFGLSKRFEAEISTSFMLNFIMCSIKYRFLSLSSLDLAFKTSYYYTEDFDHDGIGSKPKDYHYPQSIIATYGNIDHYISGSITTSPTIEYDNWDGKDKYTDYTYHLGAAYRLSKHITFFCEIANSYPLQRVFSIKKEYYSTFLGIRLFWSNNSLDLGIVDTKEPSDGILPVLIFTHHFYTK